jgi:hypothetical protein
MTLRPMAPLLRRCYLSVVVAISPRQLGNGLPVHCGALIIRSSVPNICRLPQGSAHRRLPTLAYLQQNQAD